jgi:hypothetical protein
MNMQVEVLMIDFKGSHYPKDLVLYAVFFYVCQLVFKTEHAFAFKSYPLFITKKPDTRSLLTAPTRLAF